MNENIKLFIEKYFAIDLEDFNTKNTYEILDKYEQYILYLYTDDFAIELNEGLRINKTDRILGFDKILNSILAKLPHYRAEMPTFRGCYLDKSILTLYENAFESGKIITQECFFSTSKSELIAKEDFMGNVFMTIRGKTGKDISLYSHKIYEKEVLFKSNTQFEVMDFYKEDNITYITLEEI